MQNQRLLQLPWALSTRCACGSWLTAAGPELFFLFFFGILQSGAAARTRAIRERKSNRHGKFENSAFARIVAAHSEWRRA
jgi:hypothetical protein